MRSQPRHRLKLTIETLRRLSATELRAAAGGTQEPDSNEKCTWTRECYATAKPTNSDTTGTKSGLAVSCRGC